MRIKSGALYSLIAASSFFTSSLCWAGESDPFAFLPASCATEARIRYDDHKEYRKQSLRVSGQGGVVWDLKSPAAGSAYQTFGFETRLLKPAAKLLFRGIANDIKPRISNKESRAAQRLGKDFDAYPGWWLLYSGLPYPKFTKTMDEYQCITDHCPQGATCDTLDVKKSGEELLKTLPAARQKVARIFRWADSVKIFGSRVDRLRDNYNRDEAAIKQLIDGLPNELVVISVLVPIN